MVEVKNTQITDAEAALYDRQIRLWGLDAQKRLRKARVLLAGVGGLGAEVAKNIVLAGISSLTLLDHALVADEDATCQFLVPRDSVGTNRAQASLERTQQLNPLVNVSADDDEITSKPDEFFTQFDVIILTACQRDVMIRVNELAHANNIQFFAGDVFGFYGYMFTDLGIHDYAEEIQKKKKKAEVDEDSGEPPKKKSKEESETVTVKRSESFVRLARALNTTWTSEAQKRRLKRCPNAYFVIQVLIEFANMHGRAPRLTDSPELLRLRDVVCERIQVPPALVKDEFSEYCFASFSPVCAVVGGVLGQEVIKAVSRKDAPHKNFFFYDLEGNGMVDCFGEESA